MAVRRFAEALEVMMSLTLTLSCVLMSLSLSAPGAVGVPKVRDGTPLGDYIQHFEGLVYDRDALHASHTRSKRSTDPYVTLKFTAHGRDFELQLEKGSPVFAEGCIVESSSVGRLPCDTSPIYHGTVVGDAGSHVHGSIIGGRFAGHIYTSEDVYHVEKYEIYFKEPQTFHSVIYKDSDVDIDPQAIRSKRSAEQATCGATDHNVRRWMESVQNSAIPWAEKKVRERRSPSGHSERLESPYSKYHHSAQKRETDDTSKRTCTLFLQSDTQLWEYFKNTFSYSDTEATEEITSLFANHVDGLKRIYQGTVFTNGLDGASEKTYKGFTFLVRRIKINETDKDCPNRANTQNNKFCQPNIDVSNFLNLNSLINHDEFCLAYIFTYRDFTGGTLGLAWVGAPSTASGGICEEWTQYNENGRRVHKSLNTGIITLVNYGSRVPPKVSTLTLAHEVGHNFGSPHDSGEECTPYSHSPSDPNGNYIMFASATSGDRQNNRKFSPCSIRNMTQVIHAVLNQQYGKKNCFVASDEAFCGNKIVEADEQCDCGYTDDCIHDECCYPKEHEQQCRRKENVECSPSEGPCCMPNCTKVTNLEFVCAQDTECQEEAKCDGKFAQCPEPEPKTNLTVCNGKTQVCISGVCQGSICQKIGWEQCYLTDKEGDGSYDKGNLCFVACADPTDPEQCISTGDRDAINKHPTLKDLLEDLEMEAIKLPPGAPCDNFQGYCDVFQKCRGVDADGPLARLKDLLFSEETFNEVKDWIMEYWWAVGLMALGVIILMGVFIKVCAVHTPSSNPKQPPARKLTLRRQPRSRTAAPPPGYPGPSRGGPPAGGRHGPSSGKPSHGSRSAPQYEMHNKV